MVNYLQLEVLNNLLSDVYTENKNKKPYGDLNIYLCFTTQTYQFIKKASGLQLFMYQNHL